MEEFISIQWVNKIVGSLKFMTETNFILKWVGHIKSIIISDLVEQVRHGTLERP